MINYLREKRKKEKYKIKKKKNNQNFLKKLVCTFKSFDHRIIIA